MARKQAPKAAPKRKKVVKASVPAPTPEVVVVYAPVPAPTPEVVAVYTAPEPASNDSGNAKVWEVSASPAEEPKSRAWAWIGGVVVLAALAAAGVYAYDIIYMLRHMH